MNGKISRNIQITKMSPEEIGNLNKVTTKGN